MGQPAAKQGDQVTATDTHILLYPSPGGPVPTPTPLPFNGILNLDLSTNVRIEGRFAATQGSRASNTPPHIPPQPFQIPPSNLGEIITGSATVRINGKPAARSGDTANTCNDPADLPVGTVVAAGTVMIG